MKLKKEENYRFICNIPKISPWFLWRFPWLLLRISEPTLEILHCFISYAFTKLPYNPYREYTNISWGIHVENSLQFLRGFSFHLQPKFPCGFPSIKQPPSLEIPRRIRVILPAQFESDIFIYSCRSGGVRLLNPLFSPLTQAYCLAFHACVQIITSRLSIVIHLVATLFRIDQLTCM